ncbi:MAG: glycosyltransferase [Helicobacter sp.]|nr:glycosyltransferase [Helicobacter sp.]
MKLAILIYSLGGGGAERVLLTLLPHLQSAFDVRLFVLEDKNSYGAEVRYEVLGDSKSSESAAQKLLRLPFLARMLANRLRAQGITLCLSMLNRPNYINLLAAKISGHIAIISEHATPSLQHQSGLGGAVNRWLIRALYPSATHIVAVSSGVRNDLAAHFGIAQTRITTIHNPFDIAQIKAQSLATNARIAEIESQKNAGRIVLVAIGRLDSGKNHRLLLLAMARLKSMLAAPPLLLILGEGEQRESLQEMIEAHSLADCVVLEGFVSNPYPYIKLANATLCASLYEGFLNVLVESLALGILPISSDCPSGPREILESANPPYNIETEITRYGVLFPSGSIVGEEESLASLVAILARVCRGELAIAPEILKERAQAFDAAAIAQQYCALLRQAAQADCQRNP